MHFLTVLLIKFLYIIFVIITDNYYQTVQQIKFVYCVLAFALAPVAVGWELVPCGDVGWPVIVKCSGHTHLLFVIFRLTRGLYSRMAASHLLARLHFCILATTESRAKFWYQ